MTRPKPTNGPDDAATMLRVRGLSKSFPEKGGGIKALFRDFSFDVAANEVVGIIGHSGSGKSTLLNLIAGLDTPDAGTIEVNGQRVTKPGKDRMVVFQNYALLPWLSASGNVRLAVDEAMRGRPLHEREAVTKRYIDLVNLGPAEGKHPHELSGGMRQRVGIARALAVKPLLLLMDEPFGALDPFTRGMLQEQVLKLFYEEHQTILLITHDVDEALFMCDRILLLRPGADSVTAENIRVPFPHPRDRRALREDPLYHTLRNQILAELEGSYAMMG